jgi:halogenation protein CepH
MFGAPKDVVLLTAEYPEYFPRSFTYHVERARFDQILLDNARRKGAEVREGWTVKQVLFQENRAVGVLATSENGDTWQFRARMVVDATGRHCLLSRQLGTRQLDPVLNKISHFTHFKGAWRRDPREIIPADIVMDGSTTTDIHTIDGGWIWYIPLGNDVVSVGVVLDAKQWGHLKGAQQRFDEALLGCPRVGEWVRGATQMMEMQTVSNISYLNESFVGDGFLLVGDASMFVDPIFSAGVTIAMRGGVYAAEIILEAFEHQDFSQARLKPYEDRIRLPMKNIFRMIYNWYAILAKKDPNNVITRARSVPLLRERLIVLFSGGYDREEMEELLKEAEKEPGAASVTS